MKVRVQHTSEVNLSEETMRDVCLTYIEKTFGLNGDTMSIEDGKLVEEYEVSAGNHSYFEKTIRKKASKQDTTLLEAIKIIRAHKYKHGY